MWLWLWRINKATSVREELRLRRLRYDSPWLGLIVPVTIMGLWFLLHQLWNGFNLMSSIFGMVLLVMGLPICTACVQRVVIANGEIFLKLAGITLRKIPARQIRTLAGATVSLGRGGANKESLIILSLYSVEELVRGASTDIRARVNQYYCNRFLLGFLNPGEGIWLSYSSERAQLLRSALPEARDEIT